MYVYEREREKVIEWESRKRLTHPSVKPQEEVEICVGERCQNCGTLRLRVVRGGMLI